MNTRMYLALDVGGTKIAAGVVTSRGIVLRAHRTPARPGCSRAELLSDIREALGPCMTERIAGRGVGFPALGDYAAGILHGDRSLFPCVDGFQMREYLSRRYGVPVRMTTDANMFALGVWRYGEGRGYRGVLALTLGTAIGIGLILEGRLVEGPRGVPDDALSLFQDPQWQGAAGHHFTRRHGVDARTLAERARVGDSVAAVALEKVGESLAWLIERLISLHPVDVVIVGGGLTQSWDIFAPTLLARLGTRGTHVVRTSMPYPALSGAAALFLRVRPLLGSGGTTQT